jgi:hypothetical protein
MTEKLRRRDMVKAAAAIGGLLALGGAASGGEADPKTKSAGEWLNEGNQDQPCAVFQHGRVLLLVNENGYLASAKMTEETKFVTVRGIVVNGEGWEEGLVGELTEEGKAITWANGSTWKRP